jgi:hypothetical protein
VGGEVAINGERLAKGLVGVSQPAGFAIDGPDIVQHLGKSGPCGGVVGGEVAINGERLA